MKKRVLMAVAVILWLAAGTFPALVIAFNADGVKTIDLSAIKAREIVLSTRNLNELDFIDFECSSPSKFMEKSYELAMVGVTAERGRNIHLTYVGKADNEWYRTQDQSTLGFLQGMKAVELDQQKVVIYCGKNGIVIALSIFSAALLGILGYLFFPQRKTN